MTTGDSSGERPVALASALDSRISGSFRSRYEQELFRNTGQFPIANLLLELLLVKKWGQMNFFLNRILAAGEKFI